MRTNHDHVMQSTILPTTHLIEELRVRLSTMTVTDVDPVEIFAGCISVLEYRDAYPIRLMEYCQQHTYHGSVDNRPTADGEILSKALFVFVNDLAKLYDEFKLWDENGHAPLYYHKLLGRDMVLAAYPP